MSYVTLDAILYPMPHTLYSCLDHSCIGDMTHVCRGDMTHDHVVCHTRRYTLPYATHSLFMPCSFRMSHTLCVTLCIHVSLSMSIYESCLSIYESCLSIYESRLSIYESRLFICEYVTHLEPRQTCCCNEYL
jgi:hypothetical protein